MTPWTEDRLLARAKHGDGWTLEHLHEVPDQPAADGTAPPANDPAPAPE
ncbi:hypothetical protein G5C51_05685, partial [Streptomyces sp. A7024]|nr:hypothetical protein [Streptomyces coryli]